MLVPPGGPTRRFRRVRSERSTRRSPGQADVCSLPGMTFVTPSPISIYGSRRTAARRGDRRHDLRPRAEMARIRRSPPLGRTCASSGVALATARPKCTHGAPSIPVSRGTRRFACPIRRSNPGWPRSSCPVSARSWGGWTTGTPTRRSTCGARTTAARPGGPSCVSRTTPRIHGRRPSPLRVTPFISSGSTVATQA